MNKWFATLLSINLFNFSAHACLPKRSSKIEKKEEETIHLPKENITIKKLSWVKLFKDIPCNARYEWKYEIKSELDNCPIEVISDGIIAREAGKQWQHQWQILGRKPGNALLLLKYVEKNNESDIKDHVAQDQLVDITVTN